MRRHLIKAVLFSVTITAGLISTCHAQQPNTTADGTLTASVTSTEPYPGYVVETLNASLTANFEVDSGETVYFTAMTSVFITNSSGTVASNTGAGLTLSPGSSISNYTIGVSHYINPYSPYGVESFVSLANQTGP
jgi:hypothetical protein